MDLLSGCLRGAHHDHLLECLILQVCIGGPIQHLYYVGYQLSWHPTMIKLQFIIEFNISFHVLVLEYTQHTVDGDHLTSPSATRHYYPIASIYSEVDFFEDIVLESDVEVIK